MGRNDPNYDVYRKEASEIKEVRDTTAADARQFNGLVSKLNSDYVGLNLKPFAIEGNNVRPSSGWVARDSVDPLKGQVVDQAEVLRNAAQKYPKLQVELGILSRVADDIASIDASGDGGKNPFHEKSYLRVISPSNKPALNYVSELLSYRNKNR